MKGETFETRLGTIILPNFKKKERYIQAGDEFVMLADYDGRLLTPEERVELSNHKDSKIAKVIELTNPYYILGDDGDGTCQYETTLIECDGERWNMFPTYYRKGYKLKK